MRFSNKADAETNIQAVFTEQDRHVADVSWSVFSGRMSGRLCGEKHGREAVVLSADPFCGHWQQFNQMIKTFFQHKSCLYNSNLRTIS